MFNTFTYVGSLDEAKRYQIQPNTNIILINSSEPYIYMKMSNMMGQTSFKAFRIEEVAMDSLEPKPLTLSDLESLIKRIEKLEGHNESTVQQP